MVKNGFQGGLWFTEETGFDDQSILPKWQGREIDPGPWQ
jgi:hypothetical protein